MKVAKIDKECSSKIFCCDCKINEAEYLFEERIPFTENETHFMPYCVRCAEKLDKSVWTRKEMGEREKMREILFRGYSTALRKWFEGDLIYSPNINRPCICNNDSFVNVSKKSIGQYTGLTDKNGTKIFEGDILKGSWETILTIFYDEISSSYRVKTSTGHEREPSYYGIDKWEVIGNIHDNPELLRTPQNDEVRE